MQELAMATTEDLPQLVQLVNKAYRGEEAKKGWTHEADLIEGKMRIDTPALQRMINDSNSIILKHSTGSAITGCVYLQDQGGKLYLGMLSVVPGMQGNGIGKKMLQAADQFAREKKCTSIFMTVISVRKELIAWYERHGYHNTGEEKPFHDDGRFGKPRQALRFLVLEKKLI